MNNFWTLVRFEYKKIIIKKSFIFAVVIMLFASTFCMVGDILMNGYSYEKTERELQHGAAGYIDNKMIADVISKNVEIRDKIDENGNYIGNDEDSVYNSNIRPYHSIRSDIARILSPIKAFDFENFNRLDSAEGIDFYELRTKSLEDSLELKNYSQSEMKQTMKLNEKLKTPFYQDYSNGYSKFLIMISTSSLFFILAVAICISPIFSGEYSQKTDSVILASKYGKNKMVTAKIFTAVSFTIVSMVSALIISVITIFTVYSTIGADVSFQMYSLYSVLSATMLQAVVIYCVTAIIVSILMSAIVIFLSSKLTPFSTIIVTFVLLFSGLILTAPTESLRMIDYLFPAKMLNEKLIFNERLAGGMGIYIQPYQFIIIICIIGITAFVPLAYRSFKKHQVG